ncbi:hypothetical protein PO909_007415 [Leuciscus waleckii]
MAADITLLFKASVKTVKTRNKALGLIESNNRDEPSAAKRPRQKERDRDSFSSRAREVICNISKLKEFLLQHRKDYVNAGSVLCSDVSRMTDSERDQIDQDAQIFMRTCADAISQLRSDMNRQLVSAQVKDHRAAVLDLIEAYLKVYHSPFSLFRLYSDKTLDFLRFAAASAMTKTDVRKQTRWLVTFEEVVGKVTYAVKQSNFVVLFERWLLPAPRSYIVPVKAIQTPSGSGRRLIQPIRYTNKLDLTCLVRAGNQRLVGEMNSLLDEVRQIEGKVVEISRLQEIFSEKVLHQFEQENQRLVGEMNSLLDEVRQIEGKVVEISRLQEIFSEKVLHQETEIDSIHELVVGATENVKEGNEDIREAIKNNAGFRVWILFFLVMCSFSLLFLDWYDG